MTIIFDGNQFADQKAEKLTKKVALLKEKGIVPKMVSILIGNNPESRLYLSLKGKKAKQLGIDFELMVFNKDEDSDLIVSYIKSLNLDPSVQGIMVQLPLPERYLDNKEEILSAIAPEKDIDCLTPANLGFLLMGDPRFLSATTRAVMEILALALKKDLHDKKWLAGKRICIVGGSNIVGKPVTIMLSNLGGAVSLCRSSTKGEDLVEISQKADVLISGVGKPGLIKKTMIKPQAVVIDVGITNFKEPYGKTKILGDVDKGVKEIAGFFTPVPGGVGPVTIICLLENLLDAVI